MRMDTELTMTLAFFAGLGGAGHCLGMCGAFAGASGLTCAGRSAPSTIRALAAYHLARIAAYTLIGALAAAIGSTLVLDGRMGLAQSVLYIAAGLWVILIGLRALYLPWLPGPQVARGPVVISRHRLIVPGLPRHALAGWLNGWMPCALVFSLAVKAATAPSIGHGAAWLLAFGLGTLSAMASASALARWLTEAGTWPKRIAGIAVVLLGVQSVITGIDFFLVMRHLA
jgi:sulfite exporter TauE/SafE